MRSTRRAGVLAALALLGVLAGCSGGPAEPDQAAPDQAGPSVGYRDETNGFGIDPPQGWRIGAGPEQAAVTFLLPAPDTSAGPPVTVTMNVVTAATEDDLATTVTQTRQQLPALAPGYHPVVDEAVTLPSGLPGHLFGSTFTQQITMRNLQLVVVVPGKIYVVTATTPDASFPRHEPVIRKSMMSLVLL
ncbi:hypothetical protein BKA01_002167 [Pseudonocardia eucalypti]|uniref:DcrB-related protein n=1 Tax=Pseudonocardia eucalypti TaxID=648755 RepID=UPI00161B882D|nr:hypothetical protein [Pseudonocardia eucalypti]